MSALQAHDIAEYLAHHHDFFEHHPQLLLQMQFPHPHDGQAISLIERQSLVLRERIKALENRLGEMVRHGHENDATLERLVEWARSLLSAPDESELPATLLDELKRIFDVPHAGLRLWSVRPELAALDCARPVESDTVSFANSMRVPFCGPNVGFEAASWLAEGEESDGIKSVALLPLRPGRNTQTDTPSFGLLVLGSADPDRFHRSMGTAFLGRIGELAGAALGRLCA